MHDIDSSLYNIMLGKSLNYLSSNRRKIAGLHQVKNSETNLHQLHIPDGESSGKNFNSSVRSTHGSCSSLLVKAIIPVRLAGTKSRLAQVLQPEERVEFTLKMLTDVVRAVAMAPHVSEILVITHSSSIIDLAHSLDAGTVLEASVEGIDSAIGKAVELCTNVRDALLVLPVDIPLLTSTDVEVMISLAHGKRALVVAPSRDEKGTNGLLLKPAGVIQTRFGINSFKLHLDAGLISGVTPKVYRSPTMELDIDIPRDLAEFVSVERDSDAYRFLVERGINKRLTELVAPLQVR